VGVKISAYRKSTDPGAKRSESGRITLDKENGEDSDAMNLHCLLREKKKMGKGGRGGRGGGGRGRCILRGVAR